MCHTFTTYHLCGHIHSSSTTSCRLAIYSLISSPPSTSISSISPPAPSLHVINPRKFPSRRPSPSKCYDIEAKTEIVPTLCDFCNHKGVVGEYFARNSFAKLDVLRSWKQSLRLQRAKMGSNQEEVEGEGDGVGRLDARISVNIGGDEESGLRKPKKESEESKEKQRIRTEAEKLDFISPEELDQPDANTATSSSTSEAMSDIASTTQSTVSRRPSLQTSSISTIAAASILEETEDVIVTRAGIAALKARVVKNLRTVN